METILSTKLFIPSPRPWLVARPRLIDRLNAGLERKLTLIAAPAGFGKTSLAAAWSTECARPVAWLSLDEQDADPVRFLTYLIASLKTVPNPDTDRLTELLQSVEQMPDEAVLTALVNHVSEIRTGVVLVLDDYHLLDSQPVDQALIFFIDHLPANAHLVITTREDPQFPLARLRGRGDLAEIRAADLRFTSGEAAGFLNNAMGLSLTETQVAALESRTEGWITGLQLAALSMQDEDDVDGFIRSFSGSHQFVLDYLVEEVLARQPESIRMFLLNTAILERLCGPLCDALLPDGPHGQATLERLAQANLFLSPLDNERRWYRYHHLFADLLRHRLAKNPLTAAAIPELHRRAGLWFEMNGMPVEAFRHAVLASDNAMAERLVSGGGMPLQYRGAVDLVLDWLESLHRAEFDARPSLWVTYASTLTMVGKPIGEVEAVLSRADQALEAAPPDDSTRDLAGQIAAIRAMLAVPADDVAAMVAHSNRALELLSPDNLSVRTTTAWTLGMAHQRSGNRGEAVQAFTEALKSSLASGNTMISIAAATSLGQLSESDNRLPDAEAYYRQVLSLAGDPPMPPACEALVGLGRVAYEQDDLEAAELFNERSRLLASRLETVDTPVSCDLLQARLLLAVGDGGGALAVLAATERIAQQKRFTHRLPQIAGIQVKALLRTGQPDSAEKLASEFGLPLSLARVRLAQGNAQAALEHLAPVIEEALASAWPDRLLAAHILAALAHDISGQTQQARASLSEALDLAAPGGLIRTFVDEGPRMDALLSGFRPVGLKPQYLDALAAAFGRKARSGSSRGPASGQTLVEPLSERELEVLRLVSEGLSNRQIAERLYLSLNTVKGYNRVIFQKLQVQRRTEAVAQARALNLL